LGVELIGDPAAPEPRVVGAPPKVVDELAQLRLVVLGVGRGEHPAG
jgi:hypothetical protein